MGYMLFMVVVQVGVIRVMEYFFDQGVSYVVFDNDGCFLVDLIVGWGNYNVMFVFIVYGVKYDIVMDNMIWYLIWGVVRDG